MKTNETQGPLVEIITIGDEILIGQIVDTNSAWMARELNKDGFRVHQITTVSDDESHILKAVEGAFGRADIVLMTGGLGPTKDDITLQTLCRYFKTHLIHNQDVVNNIQEVFAHRGNVLNPLTLGQAMVPASATIIQNKRGSAPVTWFDKKGKVLVSMPGVPFEMEWVMSNEVLPRLRAKFNTPTLLHKTVLVVGIAESTLAMKLTDWENELNACLKLAYLPSPGMVKLRLSGFLADRKQLETIIESELVKLRVLLENAILAEEDAPVEEIIGRLLKEKGLWIATAESCTGGNIAKQITNVSGSSSYFAGAIVAYQNELKIQELGVSPDTLRNFGAVSQKTVEEMAEGIRKKLKTDIGVGVSGIAGPTGSTDGKPVGTVWICVCSQEKNITRRFQFGQNRKRNVDLATLNAFAMIKECLE
ncbi:MAG TPA: competence/damage-inducible protein A [Bacteroidales bacterium]|nr:competence/damage-inducible protein A [Bacteroidales bacterium]